MKYGQLIAACEPSQTHSELNELLLELENFKIERVLEIGVHRGGSVRVWKQVFNPLLLIGVDGQITPEFELIDDVEKVEGYSQNGKIFEQVVDLLGDNLFDMVFIDGSHLYKDVKEDFELYRPLVRKGGVMVFHDVVLQGNDTCEVYQLWSELKEKYKTKTISHLLEFGPAATGVGIIYL